MQKITSRGQVVYIFTEPNQPIELVVKAKKVDTVLKALEALKEYDISQKVQQFNYYTNGNLKKIKFIYDENEFKWEMNYLTTNTGQVIGTKANYNALFKCITRFWKAQLPDSLLAVPQLWKARKNKIPGKSFQITVIIANSIQGHPGKTGCPCPPTSRVRSMRACSEKTRRT